MQIQKATDGDSILKEAINHTRYGWLTHMNYIYRSVWSSNITQDICLVNACEFCQIQRQSQNREPLKYTLLPSRMWQKTAADLCELDGKHFLVLLNYFSRIIDISFLLSITSVKFMGNMKIMFVRWGNLVSDKCTTSLLKTFRNSQRFTDSD
jgi:hypothetical protein